MTTDTTPASGEPFDQTPRSIGVKEMAEIEGKILKEAWIVAEDDVVDYLVLNSFPQVTKANLSRGVNYRFLVSRKKEQKMEDFVNQVTAELEHKAGTISVHALPDDSMELTMPGCLFDPCDSDHEASYFRARGTTEDKKATFTWFQLSQGQHKAYYNGFCFAWPPDRKERQEAAKALAPLSAGAAVLIGLTSWIATRLTPFDWRKEAVWATLVGFSLWIAATCLLVHTKQSLKVIRRSPEFAYLQKALQFLVSGIIVGLGVNLLSNWLGSSP